MAFKIYGPTDVRPTDEFLNYMCAYDYNRWTGDLVPVNAQQAAKVALVRDPMWGGYTKFVREQWADFEWPTDPQPRQWTCKVTGRVYSWP